MYTTIIILPLLGSIIAGFFARKVGVQGTHTITCSLIIATTMLSLIAYMEVGFNNVPVRVDLFKWIDCETLNVLWSFNFDSLTVSMLIPVLVVSSLVHIYSIEYMSHDPHNQRFFSYLSLFTFMMIVLVTANNYMLMFVGWEGVGVCSYLLVNFWYTRVAANQSSISAFLTNRVGDCFLTIGMFAILWCFGNLDFSTVFTVTPVINTDIITLIAICLLIGAMAKSSQIGLHVWLPLAMEGPTPVSALIHAATMVTAGVYLLIRSSPLLEYSSTALLICLWIGSFTTIFSSLIGLFQQDIKKVIAYSTMSQLGMMVVAIGLSSYNIAIFHLINHAFYKALLFLGAGAVIHAVHDSQDFRKYGALKQFLPLTYSVILIASLSLVAFPFMTGFYSKDLIIESTFAQFYISGNIVYYITVIAAMFTTLYSIKVIYLTFLTNPNGPLINYKHISENGMYINLPLILLAIASIFFGYLSKDIYVGLASGFFLDNSIYTHPIHETMLNTEFSNITSYKLLPLIILITISICCFIIFEYLNKGLYIFKLSRVGYYVYSLFNQRFFIELLYNNYITKSILKIGGQTTKILDKGSIELLGPFGLEQTLVYTSKKLLYLGSGVITSYALYILMASMFYLSAPFLYNIDYSLFIVIIITLIISVNNITINNAITSNRKTNIVVHKSDSFYCFTIFLRWLTAFIAYIFTKLLLMMIWYHTTEIAESFLNIYYLDTLNIFPECIQDHVYITEPYIFSGDNNSSNDGFLVITGAAVATAVAEYSAEQKPKVSAPNYIFAPVELSLADRLAPSYKPKSYIENVEVSRAKVNDFIKQNENRSNEMASDIYRSRRVAYNARHDIPLFTTDYTYEHRQSDIFYKETQKIIWDASIVDRLTSTHLAELDMFNPKKLVEMERKARASEIAYKLKVERGMKRDFIPYNRNKSFRVELRRNMIRIKNENSFMYTKGVILPLLFGEATEARDQYWRNIWRQGSN